MQTCHRQLLCAGLLLLAHAGKPAAAMAMGMATAAVTAEECGSYIKHDPGGDYLNADDRSGLSVVEHYHFTPEVERLQRGASGSLGGDIGYTLEHFPNHHRALAAMTRLALRDKNRKPPGARYSIDCFFERALRFRPDDARVHALYGAYLLALGKPDAALTLLQRSAQLAPNDATAQYNLGLLYLKRQDYPQALQQAHKAYGMGFPLPGLRQQLQSAGQWRDPD